MKEIIHILKEAAEKTGSNSLLEELNSLEKRLGNPNVPIMLPLVGEFSSGKTTLINSLTDSKALETATKPTTATIFEIHFGAPENKAEVHKSDGSMVEVSDISALKNDGLSDAKVVTVFDKSKRVPSYTILVDTPGISSPDPKHQQTLVEFLPQADALLLVVDINQQMTKSLTNFLKTVSLTGIELNAVLTKADTKSTQEIENAKKYFLQNTELPIRKLVAVSASQGYLNELDELFKDIENRKSDVLKKSTNNRIKKISEQLLASIEVMLKASQDESKLEESILEQKHGLNKIKRQIENVVKKVEGEVGDLTRSISREFEDQVSSRLSALVNGTSNNYDNEAVAAINSIASILTGEYRQKIMRILADEVSRQGSSGELALDNITNIDLSSVGIQGLSYDLDLNSLGHEYDQWIKGGVIAVGAIAAVGAVAASGGGLAGAAQGVMSVGTAVDIADTVSDVTSVMSNRKLVNRMEAAVNFGQQAASKYSAIDNLNNNGVGSSGAGKGMLDSLAGFIAEKTMSKPQRNRAIRQYIDGTLAPQFKTQLKAAEVNVIDTVSDVLKESAQQTIDEMTASLQNLQNEMRSNKAEFEAKKAELRELQTKLLTL